MARTIVEVMTIGKTPDEIQEFLDQWFSQNRFVVRDWYSDGAPFTVYDQWSILGIRVSPNAGSIVAAKFDGGWIVFEINMRKESNGTLFHGEFYVAGWDLIKGVEIDLEHGSLAMLTRQKGYAVMTKLFRQLEDFSGPFPKDELPKLL